jgi:spermidine/putrescine transport system substrate-binding protein
VNDNQEFFGKLQPLLAKGESGGRSIFVVTDWMAQKMYNLGYLQNLDKAAIPNVEKNLVPNLRNRPIDPKDAYAVPWQSGMTGLIVRTDLAPDIKSICDLFNPKYKGKVDMLTEMRDTVPLVMKCQGVDLAKATEQDWLNAIDKIKAAADSGQIRRFTGNDYADDLAAGNIAVAQAYSGDVVQLQADNPDLQFVIPESGGDWFIDTMVIPYTTQNQKAAEAWINYVYDRPNYAKLVAFTQYVPVLSDMADELNKIDPKLAANPLINPPQASIEKLKSWADLTDEQTQEFNGLYAAVTGG